MQWFETDVLSLQQQLQLARWVAQEEPDRRQPQLLFRASRDGFLTKAFHEKCDHEGPTVVLARKTNGDLFGGYAEMAWDSTSGWKQCKKAFLFSFPVGALACQYPIILSRETKRGILCDGSYHGVTFGEVRGMGHFDMQIFRWGAVTTSAKFRPGIAFGSRSPEDIGKSPYSLPAGSDEEINQVEVFAVGAYRAAPAPLPGHGGFVDGGAPRSGMPSLIPIANPKVHQPSAPTGSIPPVPCRKGGKQTQGSGAVATQESDSATHGVETVQCYHLGMPANARFCMHCGHCLKRSRSRSRTRSPEARSKLHVDQLDLEILGFKLPHDEEHSDHLADEALWDHFRARLLDLYATTSEVKEETEETGDIVTVPIDAVYNLQQRCSPHFRDGRPLEQTIQQLKNGQISELHAKACFDGRTTYYTFDHRRLFCMRKAGKQHVRVRIRLAGREFNEFARKARDRLGRHDEIRVNRSYY
eukprot:Skav206172  [mRNA]  locus=scaffold3494:43836:45248:+ [translate_table: standard]